MSSSRRYFLLGLFFLVAFGLLGYVTLFKSDLKLFGDTQEISVLFPRANGLREGDAVLVAGVRWGRVAAITYDPTVDEGERVTVVATLDDPLALRVGYRIAIEEATLLGGRNLTIDPGPADAPPLPPDTRLTGVIELNPIDALGELVRQNELAVTETIGGLRDLVQGLRGGEGALGRLFSDPQLAEDLARGLRGAAGTFENVERVTANLADGRGTLGRLLQGEEVYVELQRIAENLRFVSDELRDGRGLAGRLLRDGELGDDVAGSARSLREILDAINSGEGTIGSLVRDEGIASNLNQVFERLARGEGLLGKLTTDEQLAEDIRSFSEDIAAIAAHVRAGRGSIGRIVMDEDLYDQLQAAIGLVTRSLEEYREAAPIATMTSVIFGAF